MDIYERIVNGMKDKDTDYVSILITENGIDLFTSLEYEDLSYLLTQILLQEKDQSTIH
jgi:L-rhamnose mutarotase